jgi:hypothetical protein
MADDPTKVELEFILRDSFSEAFRTISREMVNANRRAQESTRSGGGFNELDKMLSGISKSLLGPLGIAGAMYGAAKSLDAFAVGQLQMRNFAADTGFSTEEIKKMQRQMAVMGIPAEQAQKAIGGIGAKLQEAMAIPYGSELVRNLNLTHPALAREVQSFASLGQQVKATDAIYREFLRNNAQGQANLIRETGLSRTEILAFGKNVEGMVPSWERAGKGAEEYHKKMIDFETSVDNIWKNVADNAVSEITRMAAGWGGMDAGAHKLAATINNEVNKLFRDLSKFLSDVKEIKEKGWTSFLTDFLAAIGEGGYEAMKRKGVLGKRSALELGEDESLEFSARSHGGSMDELMDVEEDSNKLLRDMRDTLDRIETGRAGGAGGGGGTAGGAQIGGPGGPMGRLPGAPTGTSTGAGGAMGGTVAGHPVSPFGPTSLAGQQIVEPMSGWLGGGVGGQSVRFGPGGHQGIDIMGPVGSKIVSPMAGKVTHVGTDGYGQNTITVDHGNGVFTRILHVRQPLNVGQDVGAGQQIGVSGHANAPHAHFEMWQGQPGARGSALMNPRAIFGWTKENAPQAGREVTARGRDSAAPAIATPDAFKTGAAPMGRIPTSAPAALGGATGGKGSPYLANQRAAIFAKIDADPRLRAEVAATLGAEGATKEQARNTLESLVNRMAADGSTDVMKYLDSGFYGPRNRAKAAGRKLSANEGILGQYDWAAGQVRAGSNVIDLRTDQGMFERGEVHGPRARKIQGEGYGDLSERHRRWAMAQEAARKQFDATAAAAPVPFEQYGGIGAVGGKTAFADRFDALTKDRERQARSEKINSALASRTGGGTRNGHVTAEVDFTDIPASQQTAGEGVKFKPLHVTAIPQKQTAGVGLLYPTDTAHTPYVP